MDAFSVKANNSPEKWNPASKETADHSIPYVALAALIDGEITEESFTPAKYRDPFVLELLKSVRVHEDKRYTAEWPSTFNCLIRIETKSGRTLEKHLTNPKGHPARTMTDDEISQKFLTLVKPVLTPAQAARALDLLWNVENVQNASEITDALLV